MIRFKFMAFLFCMLLFMLVSCMPNENIRPNVLLITADDLGIQLSCYGDTVIQTPHIDWLADEGILFTNAYVSQSSCSSSRSTIHTGLFPHQNGQVGLSHLGFSMLSNIPNLASVLKKNGYRTGIIGKLHIQPESDFPFDYKNMDAGPTREVFNVANEAEEFLSSGDGPFFLTVNYFDPHVPFISQVEGLPEDPVMPDDVTEFSFQKTDTPQQRARIAGFYTCIKRLDSGIGMLMEKMQLLNLLDNTLIIFMGDNGVPFTRGKASCYEAGVKIPFLIRYPGIIAENTVSPALVSATDIFTTVLEICHITNNIHTEGISLVPLFDNPGAPFRDYLFTEFTFHVGRNGFFPRRSVRDTTFKLIHNLRPGVQNHMLSVDGDSAYFFSQQKSFDGTLTRNLFNRYALPPEFELYNLKDDPDEYKNLVGNPAYDGILTRLKNELYEWRKRTHDPLLYDFFWDRFEFVANH